MRKGILSTLLVICMMALSSCGDFDISGLYHSSDVDDRFADNAMLPVKSDLSFSDSVFSFIVITDVHLAHANQNNLVALKDKVIASDKYVLACGDLTQCGYREDYQAFSDFMNLIGLPYYTAIGNHDLFFGGWNYYKETLGRSCYSLAAGPIRIVSMDSANGTLGRKQKAWLENVLQTKTEPLCIVFTHFEFFSSQKDALQQYTDIEEVYYLMHLFETTGVDYVFMGHSHTYDYRKINNVNYLNLPDFTADGSPKSFIRVNVDHGNFSFQSLPL
jgi:3',5'-cyclic AMP phosphodiesterase CpdA